MPELPDIELYVSRLTERLVGQTLTRLDVCSMFVLRTAVPPVASVSGKAVRSVFRIGKRIVLELEGDLFVVTHLMISGRFSWAEGPPKDARPKGKIYLYQAIFPNGVLTLQEQSTRKRASLHIVQGREGLVQFDRGGLNVFSCTETEFADRLRSKNRTLKRALTDPSWFDGIGNAYSDEILFWARLSPVRLTQALSDEEVQRLLRACRSTFEHWRKRLPELYPGFPKPKDVTAFRPDFAVHGRFGHPCVTCGKPVQHIVYAENETNYCAICQNEGRLLADRSLSRLLKSDWPRTLEEMVGQ